MSSAHSSADDPIPAAGSGAPRPRGDLAIHVDPLKHRAAERYTAGIVDACRALGAGERKGRAIDHVRAGYFKFPVGSHIIYYRLRDDDTCVVARILHERMDAPARLG